MNLERIIRGRVLPTTKDNIATCANEVAGGINHTRPHLFGTYALVSEGYTTKPPAGAGLVVKRP